MKQSEFSEELERWINSRPSTQFTRVVDLMVFWLRHKPAEEAYKAILNLNKSGLSFGLCHAFILAVRYPDAKITHIESHDAITSPYNY